MIGYFLIAIMLILPAHTVCANDAPSAPPIAQDKPTTETRKTIVYYFHGNIRCMACLNIESYMQEAVKTNFVKQLASGAMAWRVVNFDHPGNEHYTADYQLPSPSVILSEVRNGKEARWKNLEKIWEREPDKDSFIQYIREEIVDFIKPVKPRP